MIRRRITPTLRARLRHYPAVALVGPRQAGKTTLARALGGHYFDLEQPADRLRLDVEWARVVAGRKLVILDEAQVWPEVFGRLRGAIDAQRARCGRFLLLGSVSPALMQQVSESLAGRLAVIELTPLLVNELRGRAARQRLWVRGGFPDGGVLQAERFPRWQRDYLTLLCQRDLPNWGLPAKPEVTQRLLRMTAALHGQLWNASQVGQSLGLSYHTVNSYLDYLVGAFLIRRLPPWQSNLRKRLVKSPRVYWRDTGLLHSLLGVTDDTDLFSQPWVGASWEGLVIEQVLGVLEQQDRLYEAFFFRTSDGQEVDLVVRVDRRLWAIEIKLSSEPDPSDMHRLDAAADLIKADRRILVSRTARPVTDGTRISCNLDWLLAHLD